MIPFHILSTNATRERMDRVLEVSNGQLTSMRAGDAW